LYLPAPVAFVLPLATVTLLAMTIFRPLALEPLAVIFSVAVPASLVENESP
jgi:hypothetical protein